MNNKVLEQVYTLGLEKFSGDDAKAAEFVNGFVKEADALGFGKSLLDGAGKALGAGIIGAGVGLGIHGLSSIMANANSDHLHAKFQEVLQKVRASSPLLKNAPPGKVQSYGETIFKFAPHVAVDPNLLTAILSNAVHGEGIDPMTIRTLGDLESRYLDSKKGALFNPSNFT